MLFLPLPFLLLDLPLHNLFLGLSSDNIWLHFITNLGDGRTDFVLALILLFFHRKAGKAAIGAFVTGGIAVNLLKYAVGRARPYVAASPWLFTGPTLDGSASSFPSGHTTTAFALATVAAAAYPRYSGCFYAIAGLVGLSRIAVGMHWSSDVAAGAVFGIAVAVWWVNHMQVNEPAQPTTSEPTAG